MLRAHITLLRPFLLAPNPNEDDSGDAAICMRKFHLAAAVSLPLIPNESLGEWQLVA